MNNHASLYILLSFIGVAGLLVLISFLKNKGRKPTDPLAPKIPYVWDIPRYNDVEERFIKLKNVWFRLFCLVIGITTLVEGIDIYHRQPLKDFPPSHVERMSIYKTQTIKLSFNNLENLTKKQSILNYMISEREICNTVATDSRKSILDTYKKSGGWVIEHKGELIKVSKKTCEVVRNLSRALLRECSDSSCVARLYNQINTYKQTGDSLDLPKIEFNPDDYPQEAKDTFSYVGWYLDNKGKR